MNAISKFKTILIAISLSMPFAGAHANEPNPYAMPRTQVVPIKDTQADRQYELYIKLPDGYEENTILFNSIKLFFKLN